MRRLNNPCCYTEFVDTPDSTHNRVTALVPQNARVLEFGCATGYMSQVLKERHGCTVTGIEIVAEAAAEADKHCDRIIIGDAEKLDFAELFQDEEFDVVMFADVLEHLRDPGAVLRRVRQFLAPEGSVIASIPNVAHGSLRLALLAGEFRYQDSGLLDKTHLRFFTRDSIEDLFETNGYVIDEMQRQRLGIDDSEITPPFAPPGEVRELLARDPEATTYQFIVRAIPAVEQSRLASHGRELAERARELAAMRLQFRELDALRQTTRDQSEHIAALQARNDALAAQVVELRALLEDAQESLSRRDEDLQRREEQLTTRRAEELRARDEEIHWLRGVVADLEAAQAAMVEEARVSARNPYRTWLKTRLRRSRE